MAFPIQDARGGDSIKISFGKRIHPIRLAVTPCWCYLWLVHTITAKELHLETKSALDQVERGGRLVVTRNGRAVARLEPIREQEIGKWDEVMQDVWKAQAEISPATRKANPVLLERKRRRR
jgi:prevent-host-death family protein